MINIAHLQNTIKKMQGYKILVIGDMVADIYLYGTIDRISREAPVLVLKQSREQVIPGGAANVANNIATLGGTVYPCGFIGTDNAAHKLRKALELNGANTEALLAFPQRKTITKTRVIAGGRATVSQQVVRIDVDNSSFPEDDMQKELQHTILALISKCDGIVLSDYGSGTLSPKLTNTIIKSAKELKIPVIVDSRYDICRFTGVSYIKQNDAELANAVKMPTHTLPELKKAAKTLLNLLQAEGILVTRGENGMLLLLKNDDAFDIPISDKSEVYDVSGAGDTCVATFILALAGGSSPLIAAQLSNFAAGIAVRKMGTATVNQVELKNSLEINK